MLALRKHFSYEKGRLKGLLWMKMKGTERQIQPCLEERVLDHTAPGFPNPCPVVQRQQHHFTFLCPFSSCLDCRHLQARSACYQEELVWCSAEKNHPHLCHFVPLNYNNFADFPQYFFSESLTTAADLLWHRVNKHFGSQSAALLQRICHCPWNHNLTSRASKPCPTDVPVWFQSAGAEKLEQVNLVSQERFRSPHSTSLPAKCPSLLAALPFPNLGATLADEQQKQNLLWDSSHMGKHSTTQGKDDLKSTCSSLHQY